VVPHYYLTSEINVDAIERLVEQLKEDQVSLQAALLLASARAMVTVPAANAEWRGDSVRTYKNVDANWLLPGEGTGASVRLPLLRNVGSRGLRSLSEELRAAAKAGASTETVSGTFSVIDLSGSQVQQCSPVIVPNHSTALSLGAIETRPVLRGDKVEKVRVLVATLSCDHRVVDGAVGAQWLAQFKKLIEDPIKLLL